MQQISFSTQLEWRDGLSKGYLRVVKLGRLAQPNPSHWAETQKHVRLGQPSPKILYQWAGSIQFHFQQNETKIKCLKNIHKKAILVWLIANWTGSKQSNFFGYLFSELRTPTGSLNWTKINTSNCLLILNSSLNTNGNLFLFGYANYFTCHIVIIRGNEIYTFRFHANWHYSQRVS